MSDPDKDLFELYELVIAMHEGDITEEQFEVLNRKLKHKDEAHRYMEFNLIFSELSCPSAVDYFFNQESDDFLSEEDDLGVLDNKLWQALAENEKMAPGILVEKPIEKSVDPRLGLMKVEKLERKISRLSVYTLILSAAAMLFLMILVLSSPIRPVVATLTDSINAEWISEDEIPAKWDVLKQGELTLVRGLAEITFDDGAVVVVEAPAMFKLESPKSMFLSSGKISAVVSERATGFEVNTLSARIIDIGTEFGVSVEGDGSCSLHMFKGMASLIAGQKGKVRTSQIVNANEARSVDMMTGVVQNIALDKYNIVRRMPSLYELAVHEMNPVAYWQFEEDDPERIRNYMANRQSYDGKYVGSVKFESGPTFVDGKASQAVVLDGTGNYVLIPDIKNIRRGSGGYSFAMWIRPDAVGDGTESSKRYCIFAGLGLYGHISLTKDGHFIYYSLDTKSSSKLTNIHKSLQKVQPGKWYHLAVTAKSYGMKRFYVNGIECGQPERIAGVSNTCSEISLGSVSQPEGNYNPQAYGEPFNGAISEPALYDRKLSHDEVKRLFNTVK